MKILVFSDSHGGSEAMLRAIAKEQPELILHLGDGAADLNIVKVRFPKIPIRAVRGNCDITDKYPIKDVVECRGHRIFMTHGHFYDVKYYLDKAINAAIFSEADILLYGHTHVRNHDYASGVEIINPGSVGEGRHSYGVLELTEDRIEYECRFAQ